MKPFNYKWIVKIPAGCFLVGTHRFRTKKLAQEFIEKWKRTPGNHLSYADLPIVEKAKG